jgi:hypothetical protein
LVELVFAVKTLPTASYSTAQATSASAGAPRAASDESSDETSLLSAMGEDLGVDDHHGLRLSIVRGIAIAHDATFTATAWPQGGLSMEIDFPLMPFAVPRWAAAGRLGWPA